MNQASEYMDALGADGASAWDVDGMIVKMYDLAAMYGQFNMASKVGPIWFYAGPEKELPNEVSNFALIQSNALNWCLDAILYTVSIKGLSVLDMLDIPL